jgi:hypothetical protein
MRTLQCKLPFGLIIVRLNPMNRGRAWLLFIICKQVHGLSNAVGPPLLGVSPIAYTTENTMGNVVFSYRSDGCFANQSTLRPAGYSIGGVLKRSHSAQFESI